MAPEIRVVMIIPGREHDDHLMPFVRRQYREVSQLPNLDVRPFYLTSRTNPRQLWQSRRDLRNLCKQFKPQLIHAQFGTMTALWAATFGAYRNPETGRLRPWGRCTRLVITYRGSDLNPTPGDPWIRGCLGRWMSQLASLAASRIICVSPELRNRLWFAKQRAIVIPNGVDLDRFYPWETDLARRALGWNANRPIVLFNARNDPRGKRLDLAENAVEIARKQHPEVHLEVLRGNTPPDQMPIYLSAADCLLMTSDFEGSPNIVKEALACNLPVFSVPVGDVSERLKDVVPSAICPRDGDSLGNALSQFLTDRNRSNGREIISRSLGCRAVAEKIKLVYESILP